MKSIVLHLIRNMPSEGNLEGRYIGRTASPLPETEMLKLIEMKKEIDYPEAKVFYASPSICCVDTLKLIYPEADPEVILEMAECDFGDWENKTADELKDNEDFNRWIVNSAELAPPNGESGMVFTTRVMKGFDMLVQNLVHYEHDEAVLVTHGGVIMTILAAFGLPRADYSEWICEPGKGYSIRIMPSYWMRSKVVEVFDTIPKMQRRDYDSDEISEDDFLS